MKKTLVIAIALASFAAFAQTETQPATTTTESAAPAAKEVAAKPAKKAKKMKKKKSSTGAALKTEAKAVVADAKAIAAPAAVDTTREIASNSDVRVETAAAAAGTSTATTAATATEDKKWGVSVLSDTTSDQASVNDIQSLTTIGASYKVTKDIKLAAKQTFESLSAGPDVNSESVKRDAINSNNFRAAYTDLVVSSKLPAMLGSNAMPVSLGYRSIKGDAVMVQHGSYKPINALVDLNLSIPYTLSPKFDLSIDTQIRHYSKFEGYGDNTHRVLVIPTVSYNVNDMLSFYQSAGLINSFGRNERLARTLERMYLATGVSVSPIKNLSIDVNVNQDKAFSASKDSKTTVSNFALYNSTPAADGQTLDAVAYEAVLSYTY